MPESADPGTEWVEVYDKTTGRKQEVPAHYLDSPVLSKPFRKTPLSEKQQRDADALLASAHTTDTATSAD